MFSVVRRLQLSSFPTLARFTRHWSTASSTHDTGALSRSFQLTNRVTHHLTRVRGSSLTRMPASVMEPKVAISHFEQLLPHFRSNAQDDSFFQSNMIQEESEERLGMVLSPKAIIVSIDTGGESELADVGLCIYDKQRSSVYKIQVNITGKKISRKASAIENLLTTPVQFTEHQAMCFVGQVLNYFISYQGSYGGHDVCVVGHNLERDIQALKTLGKGVRIPTDVQKVDTDVLCRETVFAKGVNLRKLALRLGLSELKPFHPSVNDAYYTLHVLLRIVNTPEFMNTPFEELKYSHRAYMHKLHGKIMKANQSRMLKGIAESMGIVDFKSFEKMVMKKTRRLLKQRGKRRGVDYKNTNDPFERSVASLMVLDTVGVSKTSRSMTTDQFLRQVRLRNDPQMIDAIMTLSREMEADKAELRSGVF